MFSRSAFPSPAAERLNWHSACCALVPILQEHLTMSTQQSTSKELKNCIDACLHCYQVCTQMFMGHCLESGGRHVEPEHARLMTTCAEICRTAAHAMLSQATVH